jgi:tRNA A37 threonylcarbamoyladenosine dehydratase
MDISELSRKIDEFKFTKSNGKDLRKQQEGTTTRINSIFSTSPNKIIPKSNKLFCGSDEIRNKRET